MKDETMTKEQLLDELAKLRQEITELKLASKDENSLIIESESSSPDRGFLTDRAEVPVSGRLDDGQPVDNPLKYEFSDLVDLSLLRQLLNAFYQTTRIPYAILNTENTILSQAGWQDICTRFHRTCPQTACRCEQSDSYIATHLFDGPYIGYKCLNGLMDYATPIIIDGHHLATLFSGQFMHEPPDEGFFRCQARKYGFDEAAYLEALHQVPIIPEYRIESLMLLFSHLAQLLAAMGLERKRQLEAADQVIRKYEERLRLVLGASYDSFWDLNVATNELYIRQRGDKIPKYSPQGLDQHIRTWKKLIHPDDLDMTLKALYDHLNGHTPKFEAEYRTLSPSGAWKWILDRGQVVTREKSGQPLRMAGTSRDITVRKQAEVALLQSQEKFSKAFLCNPDIMTITTLKEGRYIEVNDGFVKTIGYERSEAIGRTIHELDTWVVPENRNNLLKQIQEHGSVRDFELEIRTKSGEIRTACLSGEIIHINGEAHLLLSTRDVTEQKQMEAALSLSEECFSKAFNASPVIMTITTLEKGRFITVNNAFCRITGYRYEDIIDRTSMDMGIWADPAERESIKLSIIEKQFVHDQEIYFCKKSGEQRLGLYSAEFLEVYGEPCMLSVLTDITDIKKMEIEMTRLDRLNTVGEMAASIGHEIRNPMTTVRGYLQILRENKDYAKETESFDLMIEELDRANSIITEFLSLAKDKMVDLKPGNLNSIIKKLFPLIQTKALSKDQHIKLELDALPDLLLDKKEIRQLIHNLVNNGIESMSVAGEITIKTFVEKKNVVLAVKDQGHGIENDLLDKLGTPFFTTKEQGTGLGLAVCYRIAARHNAKIDIETDATGTTFFVKLPYPIESAAVN